MQREIGNSYYPGANTNPLRDIAHVPSIDNVSSLDNAIKKVDLLGNLWEYGKTEASLSRYIPGTTKPSRQGQIATIEEKRAYCDDTYKDQRNLEFVIELSAGRYTNYSTMQVVLPVYFRKNSAATTDIADDVITVNNFFARWLKEINIVRYPDDITILPSNTTVPIADYSANILKHMHDDQLNTIKKTLLYSKKKVSLSGNRDRRGHSDNDDNLRTDDNIKDRISEFHDQLAEKTYYRIPLKFFTELGAQNISHNINTKIMFTLETNRNKLFETTKKVDNIPATAPDAKPIFFDRPYIEFNQIQLDQNFQQYFNATLKAMSALRLGIFMLPYRQTYEMAAGSQTQTIKFTNMPTQMEWMEISLVYDKSYVHSTGYDSYDLEIAAKSLSNIKIENAKVYGTATELNYDLTNHNDQSQLYSNFVAYQCNGCSTAPLTQYRRSEIYQKLTKFKDYFKTSDEKLFVDLRVSRGYTDELEKLTRSDHDVNLIITLKKAATAKLRLQVTTYSQAEYYYTHGNQGQIMSMQRYEVAAQKTV